MFKTVVNLTTGVATTVPLDQADLDAIASAPTESPVRVATCSAWQIRKALNQQPGMREAVEDYVATTASIDMRDGWLHASTFASDDPMVLELSAFLGKNQSETYDFIYGASQL